MIFVFRNQSRARSEKIIVKVFGSRYRSISEYKLIFYIHPCNSSFKNIFRCRAWFVQNTFKSLWFALLIDFWIQINFLFSSSHPLAWKTISMQVKKSYSNICFRAAYSKNKIQKWYLCSETKPELDLKNIILKVFGSRYWSISECKLIFYFHPCNSSLEKVFRCRARSVQNTFKSLWFALLIDFWIQINFLFSSLHPLAWKTISMQVKKSYSNICFRAAYSKNKIQKWYLCSETKPELDLKNIILKVFGSRYWSISECKLIFYFHPCNSSLEKVFRCKARSVQNTFKSLWFALLIDFWIQINFLFSSLHPLAWKTISMQVKKSYSNICFRAAYSKNKIQKWYLCSETKSSIWKNNCFGSRYWSISE